MDVADLREAARASDECAFFPTAQNQPGVIVESGPTAAMFGAPQDPRTSDLVNGHVG